ncbi:MAG: WG repeat-containing protein, partial [Pseudomonadota bacterium]
MKNRKILLLLMISSIILFSACANNTKSVQASASPDISPSAAEGKEILPSGLYPAYIVAGPEKKWGYIDENGKFIIEPVYESAADFQVNGTAEVSLNGQWKLIDKSGKSLMESQYLYTSPFSEEAAVITDDAGQSYIMNNKGQILFNTHGSIGELADGMAAFSKDADDGKSLWGYINSEGKVVIEPQFEWAQKFSDGKAVVRLSEGVFEIIDKEGKLSKLINNDNISNLSEGAFVYTAAAGEGTRKYGYMTVDGEVMLEAVYSEAQKFEDGLAIVNAAVDYGNEYGVINKDGEFVIPAKYSQITYLKNGIYTVPEAQDYYFDSMFMKKALFDKTGKQLTEFKYYNLERLDDDMISASDETKTYIIDDNGQEIGSIPKTEGIGSIKLCGELLKVDADNNLYYYTKDGKAVWASNNTVRFDSGLSIGTKGFRPDRCMLIQYPELSGMSDTVVQGKINGLLKERFVGDSKGSDKDGEMYTTALEVGFTADINKDLLIISEGGYYYPIGAAHGQPTREDYHIDLKTGSLYTLEELFRQGSNYKERLTEILTARIAKLNKEYGEQVYSEDIGDFTQFSGFAFKRDSLQIYFYPYAIASYAAGFPEFDISYDEMVDIV